MKPRVLSLLTAAMALTMVASPVFAAGSARPTQQPAAPDGPPGLPFTEDFSDSTLQDPALTNANWSTEEQALILGWRRKQFGAFGPGLTGSNITGDTGNTRSVALGDVDGDGDLDVVAGNALEPNRLYLNNGAGTSWTASDITADNNATYSVALGDVDGDGDLDLVAGNLYQPNRLYLNNGTADPFNGVTSSSITADAGETWSVALGDVDGDGDLDFIAGNSGLNRLYLNNGTANPFNGVTGSNITVDSNATYSVALGDVDGDGDLDLVAGNLYQVNRLYLNNGTADPWNGVLGSNITGDSNATYSVALGDVDGDGDLDFIAGNAGEPNRLYLNNGSADPWNGVLGSDITADVGNTVTVALGDVDGDGDLDLVAGNYFQANRLYLNNGTADPWNGVTSSSITADAGETWSVALGDVDGDGDLDVVAGNYNQVNRLYLNNGTADPWNGVAGSNITADAGNTTSVALGDVDRDGDLDLVAGNNGQPNRLYLNNGTADPWGGVPGSNITADNNATYSVALGDVDGDGDLDLVAGNYNQVNRLYLNNGTADPFNGVSGSNITGDSNATTSVALGDVDSDGDLDLVTGNYVQVNRLYLNDGTGTSWTGSNITDDDYDTTSVALGDVDRDGDLDLVAGNSNQVNRLYLNDGTGTSWTGSNITGDAGKTYSVALGDVDGDGDLDVVAGNSLLNRLYLNNGTADPFNGVSGSNITGDANNTQSVALGDVDGDGDLDLVAGNFGNQTNRLYLNNGTANPWNGVMGSNITGDGNSTYSVALGDVDGDGDLDLVAGNYAQINRLYKNNGTPNAWNGVLGSNITGDTGNTYSVALGDVDGDGDLDLVAGNFGNQTNRLYLNNGTADPWNGVSGSDITGDGNSTYSVALGDVDGDGDLDLVAGNYAEINRLYLNNGDGTSWTASNITGDTGNTRSVALGDVDGDGDLDLVAGNYVQANRLYLNDGAGTSWTGSNITVDTGSTNSVALGDVDGDGDLDVVAGNSSQTNRLYLNNGAGTSWTASDITGDTGNTRSVALGDVDGDGDLDLLAGNQSQPNRLYLNNGAGTSWTASDITGDAGSTFSVALGDVDGDGDLDVVAGNYNQVNRLYLNNGTADPFNGVLGSDITVDTGATNSVALGDVDGDGDLDLVAGNYNQINRLYRRVLFHTAHGRAGSLRVDTETDPIAKVVLTGTVSLPINTGVTYWLSNTGGGQWFQVRSGVPFVFPTLGTDLRWRADLGSLSPVRTPRVNQIQIALACLADVNNSGGVDIVDVQLVAGAFGTNVPAYDFNRSGLVDVLDIQYVADAWLGGC